MSFQTNFNLDGDIELTNKDNFHLGIVGSRDITKYTEVILDSIFEKLSQFKKVVIVSGGMYGVDLYTHNLALKFGLGTILFLPSGIESYKKTFLYRSIKRNSDSRILLVSKFDNNFKARKYTFLERNRNLVDFCDSILVAQSGIKSGSIYSGKYALETQKDLTCIPNSVLETKYQGNNTLISKGGRIYLDVDSFVNSLGFTKSNISIKNILSFLPCKKEDLLINYPEVEPSFIENILLEAILKGQIFYKEGAYFLKYDK